jgi:hypothetical protein
LQSTGQQTPRSHSRDTYRQQKAEKSEFVCTSLCDRGCKTSAWLLPRAPCCQTINKTRHSTVPPKGLLDVALAFTTMIAQLQLQRQILGAPADLKIHRLRSSGRAAATKLKGYGYGRSSGTMSRLRMPHKPTNHMDMAYILYGIFGKFTITSKIHIRLKVTD